jgi:4-hydroxy-tetrahydrodipicolinate reductase
MRIALIGYGKMGKTIEQLALRQEHEIVLKIGSGNPEDFTGENLRQADVAIEFSRPEVAFANICACLRAGVPTVCGTTAWLDRLPEVEALCRQTGGAFLYASNFSIGVNIFFAVNRILAAMMDGQVQYDVRLEEIHHTQKLDAPSGTAITLANDILNKISRKKKWVSLPDGQSPGQQGGGENALEIVSKRIDPAPGTHVVTWSSAIDTIEISHTAHSREGFAAGALAAAGWLIGRRGVFGMKDVLGFD